MAAVRPDQGDLVVRVDRGQQGVAATGEREVVDVDEAPRVRLHGTGRPARGDRDTQHGAPVEVGHPDRAVMDLEPVGAQESRRCRLGSDRPGDKGAAGRRYAPHRAQNGVGDVQLTGAAVEGQALGQPVGRERGDALRDASRAQAPQAGQVAAAGGVQEVQRAVVGAHDAAEER
ncbi:hypothetical protein ABZ235_41610 [Streptomyces canus]|uniref:hypothetical protein n=2 Tax=Streptomyces canus TaxID=58343 RepID=UPI0033B85E17